jgi:asparagine synthase (glutamine-hydrolysing)
MYTLDLWLGQRRSPPQGSSIHRSVPLEGIEEILRTRIMGSIVAVLSRSAPADPSVARRMLAASPHRGADLVLRTCGSALIGASNSPDLTDSVFSAEGEFDAVFSGKLDNASELVKTLAASGFSTPSTNPADIVVSAFRAFGPDAPNRMRGAFAAIVTDGRRMWCFRDHLGFQPLFYRDDPQGFFAATEVKQVIAGTEIKREPDMEVLERIFYGRMRGGLPSAFKGVSRLPHATTLAVDLERESTLRAYWRPQRLLETARVTSSEVEERFAELFQQAVGRCLAGDDVVSLSGGIDSPAVAGFAAPLHRQLTGRPLSALTLVFPDHPRVDERPYVELITECLGMPLYTYAPRARFLDNLAEWSALFDGPVPSISAPAMNEYYRETRRLGFRNILTGDVAECVVDIPVHAAGHLLINWRWKPLAQLISTQRRQGKSWRKITAQLLSPFVPGRIANWYLSVRGLDFPNRVPSWLDSRTVNEVPYRSDLLEPGRARWAAQQTMPLEGCPITMEGVEICAALTGVTVRRPFADIDLWEFFLSLPAEIKYPDLRSKTLLRQLLRGRLPDKILDRRDKTVFDDHVMSQVDYEVLRKFLLKPKYRIRGVDYSILEDRLERQDFKLVDLFWAKDLVASHAFLDQW